MEPSQYPHSDGYKAQMRGAPLSVNPYAQGTPDHYEWHEGWCDADLEEKAQLLAFVESY